MDSKSTCLPSDIFTCKMCGECCLGYGGTYVTEADIRNISRYINEDPAQFIEKYCDRSGTRYVLTRGEDGRCIFYNKLCTIHPVKPKMCKAWPFIESVLIDIKNWKIMGSMCPGINTNVSDEMIIDCVKKELLKQNGNG